MSGRRFLIESAGLCARLGRVLSCVSEQLFPTRLSLRPQLRSLSPTAASSAMLARPSEDLQSVLTKFNVGERGGPGAPPTRSSPRPKAGGERCYCSPAGPTDRRIPAFRAWAVQRLDRLALRKRATDRRHLLREAGCAVPARSMIPCTTSSGTSRQEASPVVTVVGTSDQFTSSWGHWFGRPGSGTNRRYTSSEVSLAGP